MGGTFQLNEGGLDRIRIQVEEGMERVGRAVATAARHHAPVRKKEYRRSAKTVSVKFSRLDEQEPLFLPSGRRNLVQAVPLSARPKPIKSRITGQERNPPPVRGREVAATRFTLRAHLPKGSRASATSRRAVARKFGGLGPPTRQGVSFRIKQNQGAQGGTLRRSISPEPVTLDGKKVRVVVRATAPYAWFMEVGFHHKGGTEVAGRHYMQKGLSQVESNIPNLLKG